MTDLIELDQSIVIDTELERLVGDRRIIEPFDPNLLSGCSYDLRVGKKLTSRNHLSSVDLTEKPYVVESGECITIDTLETVNFREVAAFGVIANKHSLAATGLFHPITTVDPGFRGPLALTFFNLGNVRHTIRSGDPIAKLFLHALRGEPKRIYGVTQRPSHREGTTAVAHFVDRPHHEDDDDALSNIYGAPVRRLYERLDDLEGNVELHVRRRAEVRRDRRIQWLVTAIIAILSSVLTNALRENWQGVLAAYHRIF